MELIRLQLLHWYTRVGIRAFYQDWVLAAGFLWFRGLLCTLPSRSVAARQSPYRHMRRS